MTSTAAVTGEIDQHDQLGAKGFVGFLVCKDPFPSTLTGAQRSPSSLVSSSTAARRSSACRRAAPLDGSISSWIEMWAPEILRPEQWQRSAFTNQG